MTGAGVVETSKTLDNVDYRYKLVFTDNDTVVLITATDAAGNTTTAPIKVTGIDVTAPVLSVTWSPCFQDTDDVVDQNNPTAGPVNVDVVDTTGCGDAFFAGVCIGQTYGKSLQESCQIGTRLAAAVIATRENVCPRFLPAEFGIEAIN